MEWKDALNEIIIDEPPEWDIDELAEKLASDSPEDGLMSIFGQQFFPKVHRWLISKFRKIKPYEDWAKKKESELQAKIKTYIDAGKVSTKRLNSNARILAREILNSYDEWSEYDIKMQDLPKERFA
jgi:hypothetical protein